MWEALGADILPVVIDSIAVILGGLLVKLAHAAVKFINKKFDGVDLEVTAKQDALIREKTRDAIIWVEEHFAHKGEPTEDNVAAAYGTLAERVAKDKLDSAVDRLRRDIVATPGLPNHLTHSTAEHLIKSTLPKLGIGAAAKKALP